MVSLTLPTPQEPFIDKAKSIYKKVEESALLKLRSRDAIAAACVFVACREMKVYYSSSPHETRFYPTAQ